MAPWIDRKEESVSGRKPDKGLSGVIQVAAGLAIVVATVTAGTGHNVVLGPQPPTVCAQSGS